VEPQRGYPRATRELPWSYPGATLRGYPGGYPSYPRVTLEVPRLPWSYPGATLRGYPGGYPSYPGGTQVTQVTQVTLELPCEVTREVTLELPWSYPARLPWRLPWSYPGVTLEVPRLPKSYPRGYPGVTQVTLEATREVTQRGYPGAP
jgi:hypothetical protein